jgi:hypothetical protein
MVRRTVTMLESEYEQLAVLKQRAVDLLGSGPKRSELLRAALAHLAALGEGAFKAALARVEGLKSRTEKK